MTTRERRYKLLVMDLDGTLLTSAAEVSPATRAALHRARDAGLALTVATGRLFSTARPSLEALGITLPVIVMGGAQIVDPLSGEALYSNPLPRHQVPTAVHMLAAAGLQPILYANNMTLLTGPAEHDSPPMQRYIATRLDLLQRLTHTDLALIEEPLELAAVDDLPRIQHVAETMVLESCRFLITYDRAVDGYFLEVFHATCSKGAALCHLAQYLGVSLSDVVAVGDDYNDVEMLRMAGLGVAMANAVSDVLAVADQVTGSNDEDGIVTVIDDLLYEEHRHDRVGTSVS